MRAGVVVLVLGVLAVLGAPAASGDDTLTFSGTVVLAQPGALPSGAVLTVTLEDVSRADAPAVTLAQTTVNLGGQQPPIPFSLSYFRSTLSPQAVYAARARVTDGDRLLFTTTDRYQVNAADPAPVELALTAVGAPAGPPVAEASLTETYWKLLEVSGAPVEVAEAMREPSLVLGADGRFAGSGGVNRLMGGYTAGAPGALSFSQVATTLMAGPPAAMAQEQAIVAALGAVTGYRIGGDRLTLLDATGAPVLTAVAVALR